MSEYTEIKALIEEKLNELDLNYVKELIGEYEKKAPYDMDLLTYKSLYYLYSNELEEALKYALQGVRQYPTNGDVHYNLAYIYEMQGELLEACKQYAKAQYIYGYTNDEKLESLHIGHKLKEIWDKINELIEIEIEKGNFEFIKKAEDATGRFQTFYGMDECAYRCPEQIIGDYYYVSDDEKKYVGIFRFEVSDMVGEGNWDLIHNKGEFLTVKEGKSIVPDVKEKEYLLPIAVKDNNTVHYFIQDGIEYKIRQKQNRHFNYYKVKKDTKINSDGISYYGNPIPLVHDPSRKKLILNIFVDGLSQEILNGDDFGKIMPNTYEYFKKGVICTQAYSTAEWTYPSLANIVTGMDTVQHMMFHDQIDGELPKDIKTIAEYFKEAGYYTAHLTGNWRIIPPYGHARGYDRYIYQHPFGGYKAEIMIADTIEQMEGFKDTDQFITICIEDLHDIADGVDFQVGVQSMLELDDRVEDDDTQTTSVKQIGSEKKIKAYKAMASHIDVLLESIYNYINKNYSEEEVIVSLFADHGQGYLIPKGGRFLAKERAKIAFMFRGNNFSGITCDEIMSAGDYISIICKLAGIELGKEGIKSNLPECFGGVKKREYAMMESIHPKDPYRAAIYAKDHTAYFENGAPTGEDGRFELKDHTLVIEDIAGNVIEDSGKYEKYYNIVMDHIAPLIIY